MQCHNYGRGTCKTSHSIQVATANAAVIASLENAVRTDSFNIIPPKSNTSSTVDYDRILQNEAVKLERVKEAYQSGVDTLEEYKRNKEQILKFIEKVKAEKQAESTAKVVDKEVLKEKVIAALDIVKDPKQPEDAKNRALRSVIEKIVFNKSEKILEVYFYA